MRKATWIPLAAALLCVPFAPAAATAAETQLLKNTDNGHFYQRFDLPGIWMQGKLHCEEQGGYLATITSLKEDEFVHVKVLNRLPGLSYFWIGGTDEDTEGAWRWVSGETWDFQNWQAGEPNNKAGFEHCLCYKSARGKLPGWNDYSCLEQTFGFVCEWDSDPVAAPKKRK